MKFWKKICKLINKSSKNETTSIHWCKAEGYSTTNRDSSYAEGYQTSVSNNHSCAEIDVFIKGEGRQS